MARALPFRLRLQQALPSPANCWCEAGSREHLRALTPNLCAFCRDTYSDRSGSSSPDLEITELKFPSVNHD